MIRRRRTRNNPPRDHFGNLIEIGDRFFCGNPCVAGTVIKIMGQSIMLDVGVNSYTQANHTMNFKSPNQGICLDKIPENIYT